jgi:hypothetical protein
VQDRYAGDLGDFLKFGLLPHLASNDGAGPPLTVGVVWHRTSNENHNADGKHVLYLEPDHALGQQLRSLDRDLYDRLVVVVSSGVRSVAALERVGVLASDTAYFSETLDLSEPPSATRAARRAAWVSRAATRTAGSDLVSLIRTMGSGARPTTCRTIGSKPSSTPTWTNCCPTHSGSSRSSLTSTRTVRPPLKSRPSAGSPRWRPNCP